MCFQLLSYRLLIGVLGIGFFDLLLCCMSFLHASLNIFGDALLPLLSAIKKYADLSVQRATDCPREPYLQSEDPLW